MYENIDVGIVSISGILLHRVLDNCIRIQIVGESVDLMCEVNEGYKKYVTYENSYKRYYIDICRVNYCGMKHLSYYSRVKDLY